MRAWQAQIPSSGHAHFCEAHYWYHWAYEFRGSGWADGVTQQGWVLADVCAQRAILAGLRALELEPRLWAVPALLLQVTASFSEPEWLASLLAQGSIEPRRIEAGWLMLDKEQQDDLYGALQSCGLHLEPTREGPTHRPPALISSVVNRKTLSGLKYWIQAVQHLHPTAFIFLRQCVWYMQPRWGGSHERVESFIRSPQCAHLSDEEKDRLMHEIWRDDYLEMEVSADDEEADVQAWRAATRQRMEAALYPFHRYEAGCWIANSHYLRKEDTAALAALRAAEQHHVFDDDLIMAKALLVVLKQDQSSAAEGQRWLMQAADRSARSYECSAALVLLGYCTLHGLLGVTQDRALGLAWLEAARQKGVGQLGWNRIAHVLANNGYPQAGFEIATMGEQAGGSSCEYLLGIFHADGVHVKADPLAAVPYLERTIAEGGNNAAIKLCEVYGELVNAAKEDGPREHYQLKAIDAARRAHEMGHTDGLSKMLMCIGDLNEAPNITHFLPLVQGHANEGDPTAMATLSNLLSKSSSKSSFDYRESVRWILGAQAVAPEDQYVQNVLNIAHQDGFLARTMFNWTRKKIKPHEIPGVDNRMV